MSTLVTTALRHNASASNNMVLDSNGRVGIGTASLARKLEVYNSGSTTTDMAVRNDTVTLTGFVDSGGGYIATVTNHPLLLATNNTTRVIIDASGRVTMPAQPVYAGYGRNPASPLNTGSESTAVIWIPGTTTINRGSHFNTSTGRFTCPIAGVYYIHGFFLTRSNAAHNITVNRNASSTGFAGRDIATAGEQGTSVSAYVDCAANDILDIRVSNGSGGDFFDNFSGILISLYG